MRSFIFPILLLFPFAVSSQIDTILPTFTVSSDRWEWSGGAQTAWKADSAAMSRNASASLAEFLANEAGQFVKSYGYGGVSVANVRGLSAAHFAVLWNGININSCMHGQTDLALLPIGFSEGVSMHFGGNGAQTGSGAVGGALQLDTRPKYGQGWKGRVGLGLGSFGAASLTGALQFSTANSATSVKLNAGRADNDFSFENAALPGKPSVYQLNAAAQNWGYMVSHRQKWSDRWELEGSVWQQRTFRQFPSGMTRALGGAESQRDGFLRAYASGKYYGGRFSGQCKLALLNEMIHYQDTVSAIDELSSSRTWVAESEWSGDMKNGHALFGGVQWMHESATVESYAGSPLRQRISIHGAWGWQNVFFECKAALRMEYIGNGLAPLQPTLGGSWKPFNGLKIFGNAARSYRVPTFNDLFWLEAGAQGNPSLKPENGWSGDLGAQFSKKGIVAQVSGFVHHINNMILWTPSMGGVWMPVNEEAVLSCGLDAQLAFSKRYSWGQLRVKGLYGLVRAERTQGENEMSLGKQLIYTPMHKGTLLLEYAHRGFTLSYGQQFVGRRFTTSSNSQWLPAYAIGRLRLSKLFVFENYHIECQFIVENILNAKYQVMEWRAMPGRNYEVGMAIGF